MFKKRTYDPHASCNPHGKGYLHPWARHHLARKSGRQGGIRIEGTFEGEITLRGLVVIGATGRLTCKELKANTVIIAGAVQGNIYR